MSQFPSHTIDTAPADSKASLEGAKKAFGFVPNLQSHMAESPELLAGYSALWDLFGKSTLSAHEQQVVYLTSNFENDCHYCMAGHSTLAKMIGMDAATVAALRAGTALPDPKLEALHRLTTIVVRERGFVPDAEIDAFLAAGYTRRNVLEVILGVATKVMSNYTNHVVHTDYDAFMKGNEWTKPGTAAA
ncbi:carboxymuconolactone decarboxylase family protein [Burkholderia plantarii]|uniref:carboxymuconolactone decarboxylase family protein n=1 Tax=Burkholderia plantarii TaxID=41899 RepID=UPI0018DEB7D5|nr:carboxymuconolactone decarboxylase family protein [Burkholderia plantarii]MBI0331362.1 carboxymuconolactone decarboxylase family protein [Burkholderia plantarii]